MDPQNHPETEDPEGTPPPNSNNKPITIEDFDFLSEDELKRLEQDH